MSILPSKIGQMKIAYLILAHNNPIVLNRLLSALNIDANTCFVHIDNKSKIKSDQLTKLPRTTEVSPRITINWGGFSVVQATLELLNAARAYNNFDRFVLISGDSYPVKSNAFIQTYFRDHNEVEFMNYVQMPGVGKDLARLNYYHEHNPREINLQAVQAKVINYLATKKQFRKPFKDQFSLIPFAGSQWWSMTDRAISFIFAFLKMNPMYIEYYRRTYIPDEMFFQTIICNSTFKMQIQPSLVFTDWTNSSAPVPISLDHFDQLRKKVNGVYGEYTPLFARKFRDSDIEVINQVEKHLR